MKNIIVTLLLAVTTLQLSAQTLTEAKAMYKRGEYEESKETFRKQLARRPNDAQLNQWYGVCLYHTGEKEKSVPYLKKAARKNIQDSYLYLGKIAYENYAFTQAKEYYSSYVEALEENNGNVAYGEKLLDMATRAESMLRRTESVEIIDSVIVERATFLNNYKLSHECGLIDYASQLLGDQEEGTLYQNQRNDKIIYSTIVDSTFTIQERNKMNDGAWSDALTVEVMPQVKGNKSYPYMMSDGLTLYFATDNDSLTIGGYDIFVTRKNLNSNEYLTPNNVGMPFNSPSNDYMMVIDEYHNVGWFATDRNQEADSVAIYIFIPREEKDYYTGISPDSIIPYAQITTIAQTWQEGKQEEYAQILKEIYTQVKPQEKRESDFEFIITPGLKYTHYTQFKSAKALELYKLSEGVAEEIKKQQNTLKELRKEYAAKATPPVSLKEAILKAEEYLKILYPQPEQYRNAARKEELKSIGEK